MTAVDTIAWAVQPGSTALTRPDRLISELIELGAVSPDAATVFHGGTASRAGSERAPRLWPSSALKHRSRVAALSPLFALGARADLVWIDLYDDWSLAPDINALYRRYAAHAYERLRGGSHPGALLTTNTTHLAERVGSRRAVVIANGVEPELAVLPRTDDDAARLVILGHFFEGRTDFDLMERLMTSRRFRSVHIGGPGNDSRLRIIIESVRSAFPNRVVVHERLDPAALALLAGPRTVALIPSRVSPYTMSQDPMKAYMFGAIGMPVISRREVWPASIPASSNLLVERGDDLESRLRSWLPERATDDQRLDFARTHSWRRRAECIADRLPLRTS
ncbi:hypothetical protein GSU68_11265 [Rathayibacter sp. VKM Ac-2759]|uniref:hypothetical protein n=1 Tax=Rathayibacter sp. VKM Ac-2759 TaxID=2609252 RepID=UPI0013171D91|nr:hypothetical protein [Rathayibacter sp. VKM Ac-2759]QHC67084.1 hypothetical protein GSU68_11265 [Rathayibacter sp. VKM Ac-2759]